ncbi:hypothetical protein BD410DRAFT_807489 [Rickenella mellea]|uniref:F-box domain-containing protein n=1 Tax=Rickenella mellea TaxID=50990 RepID=A0A4Y7PRV3_9AGAM|nr:hypothetical protein BD410DRAFT_807489 [Rickenella mellea]
MSPLSHHQCKVQTTPCLTIVESKASSRVMVDLHSLPSETLCTIFAHLRWWRQAAIADSSLWDHINISPSHCSHVPSFIARAKSRPLSIRAMFDDYGSEWNVLREFSSALDDITAHWNRIRNLSLQLGTRSWSLNISALAVTWIGSYRGFPSALESIHIHRGLQCTSHAFLAALLSHPLPESLKVVHLIRTPMPLYLKSQPLRRLTELSLTSMSSTIPTLSTEILEILRVSPELEILHLKTVIIDQGMSSSKPVSLPRLRRLVLMSYMNVPNMLMFFEKLEISPHACMHLIFETHPSVPLPILPSRFSSTLRVSEISISATEGVLTMDFHAVRPNSSLNDATVHIQFIYIHPFDKRTVIAILGHVMQTATWSRPSRLKVNISECRGEGPTAEDWTSLLWRLPTLESLEVQLERDRGSQEILEEMKAATSLISA